MAHKPLSGSLIVSADMVFFHKCQHFFQNHTIDRNSKCAIVIGNNLMGASCIKSGNQVSFFVFSNRVLGFIAIVKWFFHSRDRLHDPIDQFFFKSTDSDQVSSYFIFLEFQLFFVGKALNLTAAALSCDRTNRFCAVWRRLHDFHQAGVTVLFFCFHHFYIYNISDYGIFYKKCISIYFSDSFAIHSHIRNCHNCHIIFL